MIHEDGRRIISKVWNDLEFGPLLTQSQLISRGWTKSSIRKQIGDPDCYGLNPHGGALVLLYSEARVRRAMLAVVK
jgi:hypothetical protein